MIKPARAGGQYVLGAVGIATRSLGSIRYYCNEKTNKKQDLYLYSSCFLCIMKKTFRGFFYEKS